jgi:hypothetical protein
MEWKVRGDIAYSEAKPEIVIERSDRLKRSVWEHEVERLDSIDRESILVCLPRISFLCVYGQLEQGRMEGSLTATKNKASNADAGYASAGDV